MVQRQRGFSERREGGEPPAEKLARKRLGTQAGVRREVQRVYAQVDQGLITGMEAVRRVRVLTAIATVLRSEELEQRVRALEGRVGGRR